ncbi:MAG: SUF system NifU family Fe-S cluster assembly protein [Lentisphaeria bacterium]|nr:SUF system NifU family Fe-S cluster assembly protein [Lentisphaeria bacterium]NQZ67949.1 SUF system NifU family Fe-S cluster assembly protein [Lentisphaeria bacterium]
MPNTQELYQELILDHYKNPRNSRKLDAATHHAHGNNPLCGDKVDIHLRITDGAITDVSFEGAGCAISQATASLLTEALENKSSDEAESLYINVMEMLTAKEECNTEKLGDLAALASVRDFPMRVKCATLPWQTLKAALDNKMEITTE